MAVDERDTEPACRVSSSLFSGNGVIECALVRMTEGSPAGATTWDRVSPVTCSISFLVMPQARANATVVGNNAGKRLANDIFCMTRSAGVADGPTRRDDANTRDYGI